MAKLSGKKKAHLRDVKQETPVAPVQDAQATDQNDTTPPANAEGAEPKAKKARKLSKAYFVYVDTPLPPLDAKIHIVRPASEKPKSRIALTRYEMYREGMTVGEYIEEAGAKFGKKVIEKDVRWDLSKGFISVA